MSLQEGEGWRVLRMLRSWMSLVFQWMEEFYDVMQGGPMVFGLPGRRKTTGDHG